MIPVIAIVGRPNVGKSTLFNYLTKSRAALVADQPGLTRDRQYGGGQIDNKFFMVIDTGGFGDEQQGIESLTALQALQAINEADIVLLLVDGRAGLNINDEVLAKKLRRLKKTIYLVVNKTDGIDINTAMVDFYELSLGEPYPISAAHGRGINSLMTKILSQIPVVESISEIPSNGIKIAFVGKPNVGKSTLLNRILGEERVIVYDQPGTTRDSIFVPFKRRNENYILIDTAGVRRRTKVKEKVEKFSVIKAFQAIDQAHVVVLVIDAIEGIADQDLRLLRFILEAGRALVIAINKWDKATQYKHEQVRNELNRRLTFIDFAKIHFISALLGTGVNSIFVSINKAYQSANEKLSTPQLTRILQQAVTAHEPPLSGRRRVKLLYAHPGGRNPPLIIVHGKRVQAVRGRLSLPESYRKYLENFFRKKLKLVGTPIRIEFK